MRTSKLRNKGIFHPASARTFSRATFRLAAFLVLFFVVVLLFFVGNDMIFVTSKAVDHILLENAKFRYKEKDNHIMTCRPPKWLSRTNDLIPRAVCGMRRHTNTTNFSAHYGYQNILFPAPDPTNPNELLSDFPVLRVFYPKGSINPHSGRVEGGMGFYTHEYDPGEEAYLEYEVFFPEGFQWVRGGKLPGLFGGSLRCSGGDSADHCFSARLMWRSYSLGETYLYVPTSGSPDTVQHPSFYTSLPGRVIKDPKYGLSVGRGSFSFRQGKWTRVGVYVKLNSIGKRDGVLGVCMDGEKVLGFDKVVWREKNDVKVEGILFDTFFGGSKETFAAVEDSYVSFRRMYLWRDRDAETLNRGWVRENNDDFEDC